MNSFWQFVGDDPPTRARMLRPLTRIGAAVMLLVIYAAWSIYYALGCPFLRSEI